MLVLTPQLLNYAEYEIMKNNLLKLTFTTKKRDEPNSDNSSHTSLYLISTGYRKNARTRNLIKSLKLDIFLIYSNEDGERTSTKPGKSSLTQAFIQAGAAGVNVVLDLDIPSTSTGVSCRSSLGYSAKTS